MSVDAAQRHPEGKLKIIGYGVGNIIIYHNSFMKHIILTAIVLMPIGLTTAVWADTAVPENESFQLMQTTQTDATALETQEVGLESMSEIDSGQLDTRADEINQDTSNQREQEDNQTLSEFLNLPDGVVVRTTRGGGLAVGGEF